MSEAPSAVLSVRVRAERRELLTRAAAELSVLDRRLVTIAAADWEKFEAWVNRPTEDVPELRRLAAMRSAWQD